MTIVSFLALPAASASAATRRPAEASITEANGAALIEPFGLTVDGFDDLWITDPGASKVIKLSSAGAFLAENTGTGSWEGSPYIQDLAFSAAASEVFVADSDLDDLWGLKVSTAAYSGKDLYGEPFDTGPHVGSGYLRDAVDNSGDAFKGDIYVLNQNQHTVSRIKADGSEVPFTATAAYISGAQLTGPFGEPRSIAVGPEGNLYVVGGQVNASTGAVDEFEPSGELVREITTAGGSALESTIEALAIDPATGALLIAEGNTHGTILELSPTGTLEARITETGGTRLGRITGLAIDSTGRLYAAEPGAHRVDVFGPAEALPIESDGGSVSDVTDSAATLRAQIDPQGHPTTYQFEYGLSDCATAGACTAVPAAPVSLGSGEASLEPTQQLNGLDPNTTYHYRLLVEDTSTKALITGPDHTFTTEPASAPFALPDGRQWELVSPPDKGSANLEAGNEYGSTQAAAGGSAIVYMTAAPFGSEAEGAGASIQILSSRGADGWSSRNLAAPHRVIAGAGATDPTEIRFFSTKLTTSILEPYGPFEPALSLEGSEQTPYLRTLGSCTTGCYRPLVTAANVPPGTKFGAELLCQEQQGNQCGPEFQGASPEASHVVLKSAVPLTAGAPAGGEGKEGELYEWSGGSLQLVSVLPPNGAEEELPVPLAKGEVEPFFGASFGSGDGEPVEGAISSDGSRIFFTYNGSLYLRDTVLGRSLELDAAEPACMPPAGECESGGGVFQFASNDGSRVFFTDKRRLTADSGAGAYDGSGGSGKESADLYECRIGESAGRPTCALTDLTPAQGGEPARVQGAILGAAAEGSAVYFVADGVIPGTGAEPGTCVNNEEPQPAGAHCNLYELSDGAPPHLVAALSGADRHDWADPRKERPTRVSPNGDWLTFLSQTPLTGYDNRDAVSGQPDAEAFLYDAQAGRLVCASCLPSGARPTGVKYRELETGASKVLPGFTTEWEATGWIAALLPHSYQIKPNEPSNQPRYLSNSGRLYFDALDPLVPADTNGVGDVYQYEPPQGEGQPASDSCTAASPTYHAAEGGCVDLISSGTSPEASQFIDASESGDDVFFLTTSRLAGADVDDEKDVYDAHACSSEASCAPEPALPASLCGGESCQALAVPPAEVAPSSQSFSGGGNFAPAPAPALKAKPKALTRAQLLARALEGCRKDKSRKKRLSCERQSREKYGTKKRSTKATRRKK